MAAALVSVILEELGSIIYQQAQQEVKLVVGVEKEIEILRNDFLAIQAVLEDAERKQLNDNAIEQWLTKLKEVSYDMDDVLDEWSTAILKQEMKESETAAVPMKKIYAFLFFACFCFHRLVQRRDIALEIKKVTQTLDEITRERERFGFALHKAIEEPKRLITTSFVDVSQVRGREDEKKTIISKLLCGSSQEMGQINVISIVGMGGIGKTTLAQLTYNDEEVKANFEKRIWVCVSDPFDEKRVAKAIMEELSGATPNLTELQALCRKISESIQGKKFLLVLDDIWSEDPKKWEPLKESLKCGAPGSRILVTTRKEPVAKMMESNYSLNLGKLSDDESWSLFVQLAFYGRTEEECKRLTEVGRQIVDKCKGLPLAVKTLGCLMQSKITEEEWENILLSELWELKKVETELFPPLLLSYYDLSVATRRCFTYCATFPKDHVMERNKLIKMWMAQGYLNKATSSNEMELVGKEYFDILATRAFFQDFQETEEHSLRFKMHDIVHDFAQFLTKDECYPIEADNLRQRRGDPLYERARHSLLTISNWVRFPKPIYNAKKLRSLLIKSYNDFNIGEPLQQLLTHMTRLRLFDLSESSIEEIPSEVGNLIHLRYLDFSYCKWLKVLPETISELYNLQSLNVTWCASLETLPQKMRKLTKLRHLEINGSPVAFLPKGIEKLSSLRTLTNFIVYHGKDEYGTAKLGELENLNLLKGTLWLENLRNVRDVSEAVKANIKDKKRLIDLHLMFTGEETELQVEEDALIEALQPPVDLEVLSISEYGGISLPNWLMSLTKLRRLDLSPCGSLEVLPPLGRLPYLEKLTIGLKIKKLGVGYLGMEEGKTTPSGTAFPKLKELSIWKMEELEEWDGIGRRMEEKDTTMTIMPQLQVLEIKGCPKLQALPDYILAAPLQELTINECPILKERYQESTGEDWKNISHIPDIEINFVKIKRRSSSS